MSLRTLSTPKDKINDIGNLFFDRWSRRRIVVTVFLSFIALIGMIILAATLIAPKATLASGSKNVDSVDQITIKFSQPVARKDIQAQISPAINGAWEFPNATLDNLFAREIVFHPDSLLTPSQTYEVKIGGIHGVLGFQSKTFTTSFRTATLPRISGVSVKDSQSEVSICDPININLDNDASSLFNLDVLISPDSKNTATEVDPKIYSLKFDDCLQQGTAYTLTLGTYYLDPKTGQKIVYEPNPFVVNFKTALPPQVASYAPQGNNVLVSTSKFSLSFSAGMKTDYNTANTQIAPAIAGAWKWENDQTLSYYFSNKLAFGTSYSILFPDPFYTANAGYTDPNLKFQFETIGSVQILSSTPRNNASQVLASSTISVNFNQSVDQKSAQNAFGLSPTISGNFSWNGNKMTFSPNSPLTKSTAYTFGLTAPVASINGLPMTKSFSSAFTTEDNTVILNIPVHYQDKALSCEAAATQMALNYKGANVTENDIMNYVGFDPTIRNGNIWGDPNSAFVGSIDGKQDTTGYGVYWGPIANAASHFRQAQSFRNGTAQQLAQALNTGNPIVIWGTLGNAVADSWQTPAGATINAWKGEHSRTVVGFKGTIDNPIAFYINDPVKGRVIWTTATLLSNWSAFQNSGVIIY